MQSAARWSWLQAQQSPWCHGMPRPPRQQRPAAEAVIHLALLPVLAGVLVAAPVGVLVLAMPPLLLLLLLLALPPLLHPRPPRLPGLACQCSQQSHLPLAAHCCSRCAPPTPAVVNPQASLLTSRYQPHTHDEQTTPDAPLIQQPSLSSRLTTQVTFHTKIKSSGYGSVAPRKLFGADRKPKSKKQGKSKKKPGAGVPSYPMDSKPPINLLPHTPAQPLHSAAVLKARYACDGWAVARYTCVCAAALVGFPPLSIHTPCDSSATVFPWMALRCTFARLVHVAAAGAPP